MIQRVIFFQPRTYASENYQNAKGTEQRWVPWSALVLAPFVHWAGMTVELIDTRIDSSGWIKRIQTLGPNDMLAVSVMTGHSIRDALQASEIARDRGCKTLWGGPHVSLFPMETLRQAPVDAVVPGFGYAPFSLLLDYINKDRWPVNNYGGVYVSFECSDDHFRIPYQSTHVPFGLLPKPYLDLVTDWEFYINPDISIGSRIINLITSEGCNRGCTYCSEPRTSASTWLIRDLSQVIATAKDLRTRSDANGMKLHDPNFFHDIRRAIHFSRLFKDEVGIPWAASMHPSNLLSLSEECLEQLAHNGLVRVLVGLESPDPGIVKLAGKRYDPLRIPEMARKLAKARIRGMFTFIVGWPNADPSHYELTIECAFGIRAIWEEHQAKIHFLEPWPGTPIYKLLSSRGFCFPKTINEWADIDYYQAKYTMFQAPERHADVQDANRRLSPYVSS